GAFALWVVGQCDPPRRSAPTSGFECYRVRALVYSCLSLRPGFPFLLGISRYLRRRTDSPPCAGLATLLAAPALCYCPLNTAAIVLRLQIVVDQFEVECNKFYQPSYEYNRVDN